MHDTRDDDELATSPAFHAGELALQREAGVAERLARYPRLFLDYLPEQHRAFYPLLPFVVVGSGGPDGQPTASLLAGPPGFAWSPTPVTLRLDALPLTSDPLGTQLELGAPVGLLGIQPHTRRRNRLNGRVLMRDTAGVTVGVAQAFGNCPKYIHPRELVYSARARGPAAFSAVLGAELRARVAAADTFFIASAHPEASAASSARAHGVDVSHRGGPPGFLHFTSDDSFSMPDYRGNNFFNTLGNLSLDDRAGLLFVDTVSGDLLQITARVEATAGAHPAAGPESTGRILRFHVTGARLHPGGAALRQVAF
jgi:predicted pyridoxine 5'-phosphate oxidase superfamily flavin-nucleotide-binding protein